MKKIYFIFLFQAFVPIVISQVGININNHSALSVFHVHPPNKTDDSGDFIVDLTGQVGIGNTLPTSKLDLNGSLRIADGSEGELKVMTSDNDGVGTWDYLAYTEKKME